MNKNDYFALGNNLLINFILWTEIRKVFDQKVVEEIKMF